MRDFLLSIYPWIKTAHIIMIVAWMAGMMYLPRLFVYHHQASKGGEAAGYFVVMERRLLKGITNPSMIMVWFLGVLMLYANPGLFSSLWISIKLLAVTLITGIHGFYASSFKKFEAGETPKTEKFWRIMNEAPFVLLIIAVALAVVKPF